MATDESAVAPGRLDEIHRAALQLFAERGYEATTMAEIGARVGIRGPSLYKHVPSKQHLLGELMVATMDGLARAHRAAVDSADDPVERLAAAIAAHVRYHVRHRVEAFVGNREIRSLDEPYASRVRGARRDYANGFRRLIAATPGADSVTPDEIRLRAYAILDLGMGVAAWYRDGGPCAEDEVIAQYTTFGLRLVGVEPPRGQQR